MSPKSYEEVVGEDGKIITARKTPQGKSVLGTVDARTTVAQQSEPDRTVEDLVEINLSRENILKRPKRAIEGLFSTFATQNRLISRWQNLGGSFKDHPSRIQFDVTDFKTKWSGLLADSIYYLSEAGGLPDFRKKHLLHELRRVFSNIEKWREKLKAGSTELEPPDPIPEEQALKDLIDLMT